MCVWEAIETTLLGNAGYKEWICKVISSLDSVRNVSLRRAVEVNDRGWEAIGPNGIIKPIRRLEHTELYGRAPQRRVTCS